MPKLEYISCCVCGNLFVPIRPFCITNKGFLCPECECEQTSKALGGSYTPPIGQRRRKKQ